METITEAEIKEKLAQHSGGYERELIKNARKDDHGTVGSIVYSLEGSPPKGYAIAIPEIRQVSLYDGQGKRFKILKETVIEGHSHS